jgi:hypothetical protein
VLAPKVIFGEVDAWPATRVLEVDESLTLNPRVALAAFELVIET